MNGKSLDDIAARHDIRDLAGMGNKKVIVCPLPQHTHAAYTPSFAIRWHGNRQRFKCYGTCGLQGDAIDFIGYMKLSGYDPTNFSQRVQAAELLEGSYTPTVVYKPQPLAKLPPEAWRWFLPPAPGVVAYCLGRGIREDLIERFHLGSCDGLSEDKRPLRSPEDHFLAIPTIHAGQTIGIKFRNTRPSNFRFFSYPGSTKGLFNYDEVLYTTGNLLLTKSEITALVALPEGEKYGFLVAGFNAGENSDMTEVKTVLKAIAFAHKVYIGDNDPLAATDEKMKRFAELRAALVDAELHYPPPEYKDLDQWILADPQAGTTIARWFDGSP